ncbi:hypothetical protein AnigIFM49718_003779 [Aspergillus niger]|nr:hypothetical protein AnigIFM49718_003779 [Aspergillus niger]
MASISAGALLERTIYSACSLGFMPVAIRLRLFDIVAKASRDGPLSSIAILAAYRKEIKPGDPKTSK